MSDISEDPDVDKLKASVSSYRSHFTRQKNIIAALSDTVSTSPTSMVTRELEDKFQNIRDTVDKLVGKYLTLNEVEPKKEWDNKIGEYMDELMVITKDVNTVLANAATPAAKNPSLLVAAPGAAAGAPGPKGPRIIDALKPKTLSQDATPAELRAWKIQFQDYYTSSEMSKFPVQVQRGFFTSCIDKNLTARVTQQFNPGTEVFSTATNKDACMVYLDEDFERRYPLFARRLQFFQYSQSGGQSFSDYVAELQKLGEEADLHSLKVDEIYVFRVIAGVTEEKLRERFFKLTEPSMKDIMKEGSSHEAARNIMKVLKGSGQLVSSAAPREGGKTTYPKGNYKGNKKRIQDSRVVNRPVNQQNVQGRCWKCGATDHNKGKCRKEVYCDHCKVKSHSTSICFKKAGIKPQSRSQSRASSPTGQRTSALSSYTDNYISSLLLGGKSKPTPRLLTKFRTLPNVTPVRHFEFQAMPDTGATRTVIAFDVIRGHEVPFDRNDKERLYAANFTSIKCIGSVKLLASVGGEEVEIDACVSAEEKLNDIMISWHDLIRLGVIPDSFPHIQQIAAVPSRLLETIMDEYKDVVSDTLGERVIKGPPMRIHIREDIPFKPQRVLTTRQTPLHLQEEATKELERLIQNGVVEPISEPTDCISPSHFVQKDFGKVRLVTDFKINPFVKRPVHPFPSSQDILQSLAPEAKWFAKLDAVQGYFQIPLDEESSKLTTFLLPTGRYCYKRAPMGLNASSDEFCARTDQALHGIKGIHKVVDDILVSAASERELYEKIKEVLDRCREHGITISKKKMQVGQEIKFVGFIVSANGVKPDPDKTKAIEEFPSPMDVTSLRSFLGLANQLGSFLPDLAHATVNIRGLMKKNVAFNWLEKHAEEFKIARKILTSPVLLKPYDVRLDTELLTDASRLHGLGFVLLQRDQNGQHRLILCGSRSLTDAETRYATIELELQAIVWATEKCRHYLLGLQNYTVLTDHRPLEGLFKKSLVEIDTQRLQRLRERLLPYSFVIKWTPGKNHQIADALSRAPVFGPPEEDEEEEYATVNMCSMIREDPALTFLFENIDARYRAVVDALRKDKNVKKLPDTHAAKAFSNVWCELSLMDDREETLLLLGHRLVVPSRARQEILKRLHLSHSGLVKTKKQAQQLYFWPGMNRDITDIISKCDACNEVKQSQQKEPMSVVPPAQAMSHVGMDLFELRKQHYLVMVDRYSGFPFTRQLKSLSTAAVTKVITEWFYLFGFPEVVRSDGGPQFRTEFEEYCKAHYISHEKSSPYYPQSNGLAEAAVKSVKTLLAKCKDSGEDFEKALFAWRNTPRADGFSPAEMFLGRRMRDSLPAVSTPPIDQKEAAETRQRTRDAVRGSYDESAKPLSVLLRGDRVMVQHPVTNKWYTRATVIDSRSSGRSYIVQTDEGSRFPRNRRYLRPVKEHLPDVGERQPEDDRCVPPSPRSTPTSILRRSPRLKDSNRRVRFK